MCKNRFIKQKLHAKWTIKNKKEGNYIMMNLQGSWVAMPTPFTEDNKIDFKGFEGLNFSVACGEVKAVKAFSYIFY